MTIVSKYAYHASLGPVNEAKIDNRAGRGAVPYNQEVDYFGLRVVMKPSVFLDLATPLNEKDNSEMEEYIRSGGAIGAPFLDIAIPQEWDDGNFTNFAKIQGHEGRHRMRAIMAVEGDTPIEVHLFPKYYRARDLTPEFVRHINAGMYAEKSTRLVLGPLFSTGAVSEASLGDMRSWFAGKETPKPQPTRSADMRAYFNQEKPVVKKTVDYSKLDAPPNINMILLKVQNNRPISHSEYTNLKTWFDNKRNSTDEAELNELANTSLKLTEPKDFENHNDRKQTTYKLFKFKSGKDTYLINFTVKGAPASGKKQNWNAVNVAFGVKEKQDEYSFGDEIDTDLTARNKNQFLIYSTVINAVRKFITEYNTEIDEIIMQGAGERQEAMYQRFFQSAGKYFPGWHYNGKHSLVRDVPRPTGKKVKEEGVAEGSESLNFEEGDCPIFAIALHRLSKLPLMALVEYDEQMGDTVLIHAYVKLDDRWRIDSSGETDINWMLQKYPNNGNAEEIQISEKDLLELGYGKNKCPTLQQVLPQAKEVLQGIEEISQQGVAEAFDQPRRIDWEQSEESEAIDAIAQLSDGTALTVMFEPEAWTNDSPTDWSVSFWRGNSQEVTGAGNAQEVFATVLSAIRQFVHSHQPESIEFSASKDPEVDMAQPGANVNPESRAKLYDRMVNRYASAMGYQVRQHHRTGQVTYTLRQVKKNVTEDQDYMAGHCHVMAIALKMLHPDWQIRAHVGWEDEEAEDDEYRVDHVYTVAPDGTAYDCRGQFPNEESLVGEDVTGGFETQYADFDLADIEQLVQRGELKRFTRQDIDHAMRFAKQIDQQDVAENFADGKGPGRAGDSQRHGIPKHATMAELEKASHAKGRKGQLARWQLNMRRGRKKAHEGFVAEGGWANVATQNTVITPAIIGEAVAGLNEFANEYNAWQAQNELGLEIKIGNPKGSGTYYKRDLKQDPEREYGDIDIECFIHSREGVSSAQLITQYKNAITEFTRHNRDFASDNGTNIIMITSAGPAQVDLIYTFNEHANWSRALSPEYRVKGVISTSLTSALAEVLNFSFSSQGVQVKTRAGRPVSFRQSKDTKLQTVTTNPESWARDMFQYYYTLANGQPYEDRLLDLDQHPGLKDEQRLADIVHSIRSLATELERNNLLGQGALDYIPNAHALLTRVAKVYADKLEAVINSSKFDKAATPAAEEKAKKTKLMLAKYRNEITKLLLN